MSGSEKAPDAEVTGAQARPEGATHPQARHEPADQPRGQGADRGRRGSGLLAVTEPAERSVIGDHAAADERGTAYGLYHLASGLLVLPGAVLFGAIAIGDGVRIGPNAVVMTNVPAGAIVTAPLSRIMVPPKRKPKTEAAPADPGAHPDRKTGT